MWGLELSGRNIVEVKTAVHAMFMVSGDPPGLATAGHDAIESAPRRPIPHLHGMLQHAVMVQEHLTSAAATDRPVARLHVESGEMTC